MFRLAGGAPIFSRKSYTRESANDVRIRIRRGVIRIHVPACAIRVIRIAATIRTSWRGPPFFNCPLPKVARIKLSGSHGFGQI